jgi:4-hydroxybenzoate polyprenyltransferase
MRLNKPIGIWLLFLPASWGVALAGGENAGFLMILMLVGAAITRSAGCILNDLADRRLDALVERTRNRPLASGAIKPWQAIMLLVALLIAALVLALMLPFTVLKLALLALPMIAAYPFMKRITWWPQLFLGLTFNLGALMGWAATGASLSLPAFTLYTAAIFWTLGYDTIYAVQDMADDAMAGIKSSARRVGTTHLKHFVMLCYGLMLALLAFTGMWMQVGVLYYLGLGTMAAQLLWQLRQLPCDAARAGALFCSNQWAGLAFLIGLMLHPLL